MIRLERQLINRGEASNSEHKDGYVLLAYVRFLRLVLFSYPAVHCVQYSSKGDKSGQKSCTFANFQLSTPQFQRYG